jgi:hypothetical protein
VSCQDAPKTGIHQEIPEKISEYLQLPAAFWTISPAVAQRPARVGHNVHSPISDQFNQKKFWSEKPNHLPCEKSFTSAQTRAYDRKGINRQNGPNT